MDIPATIFVALGAISAALLAGYFSFTNMLISKDQKVTEFRHDSISLLRKEVSRFISNASVFASLIIYMRKRKDIDYDEFIFNNIELLKELQESYSSIKMMINPVDDADFIEKLDELFKYVSGEKVNYEVKELNNAEVELTIVTQQLLKREWNRVKTGERLYRFTKWATLIGLSVMTLGVSRYIYTIFSNYL